MKQALLKLKKGFLTFGTFMASIVNFFLLLIVYLVGIGLTAIAAKLFRKHFLDMEKRKSYWKEFEESKRYSRMF